MIKSELIEKLAAENTHLTHAEVERLVNVILNTMTGALSEGGRAKRKGLSAPAAWAVYVQAVSSVSRPQPSLLL